MTKLLSALIVAAIGAFSFSAQAASHTGAAPMAASAPMMKASAPMAKASGAMKKEKKDHMKKDSKMEEKK